MPALVQESLQSRSEGSIVCVDLDGCLLETDTLLENALELIGQNPLKLFALSIWLCGGRAHLKAIYCRNNYSTTMLDVRALAYNQRVLDYLRTQKNLALESSW